MSQAPDPEAPLSAKLPSLKPLLQSLTSIHTPTNKSQEVSITPTPNNSLRFTTSTPTTLASVIIPSTSFSQFSHTPPLPCLNINLSLLIDSLNIFGREELSSTTVHMWWLGTGPLYVRLFEGDTATICEIATVEGEESVLEFGADVSNEAILDCDTFREALQELSILSSTTASLRFSPDQPRFALRAPPTVSGVDSIAQIGGEVTIVLADPSDPGCDVFQSFRSEHTQEYVYKLEHLGRCIKALGMAESCKVAMNAVGGLSVMCRMRDDGFARGERCFVEFIVASQESEDAEGSAEASAEASADEQGVEEESDEDDEVAGSDEDFV